MFCRRIKCARLAALVMCLLTVSPFALAGDAPLGCSPKPEAPAEDLTQPFNLDLLKKRLIYYRCTSYEADIARVLDEALAWVKMRAPEVAASGAKPAIILDIDETSLSNWTRIYRDQFAYLPYGDCDLNNETDTCGDLKWQREERAPAIVPTLNLYKFARCLDVLPPCKPVEVFFITGRKEKSAPIDGKTPRQWTRENLISAGYADVADDHLFLRSDADDGVADYKSRTRANIESVYRVEIIANLGDQQSDLDNGHAERPFKLPNPFYYIPSH